MRTICQRCGRWYDVEEWLICPHCARNKYRERNPTPNIYPWWTKDRIVWC